MGSNKNIRYINWEKETIQDPNQTWVLPQIAAYVGSHWPLVRNVHEQVSPTLTLKGWKEVVGRGELTLGGDPLSLQGVTNLIKWINLSPRGEVLGSGLKQTSREGIRWSAPVPLMLSFWKEFRGVAYSSWDWKDPQMMWFVDRDVLEWVNWTGEVVWSDVDLLQFRVGALEVKTGKQQGKARKPESCSQVYGVADPEFKTLPRLMKLALTQLWCFHPSLRHHLMITDRTNLDVHPPPLVDSEVFDKPVETIKSSSPWDL